MLDETEGDVRFEGESIVDLEPHEVVQRGIGKSFQTASIFPDLSVEENANIASFGAEHGSFRFNFFRHRNAYPEVEQRTREVLDAVELLDQRETTASALPYGDKRRLELGIALASEPSLLLMDEPTAGMSPEETAATVDLVEDLQADLDLTIMLVEHDMEVVFRVSDRIAVLNRGSIIAEGTPEAVQGDPAVQEAYLGGVEL
jgi:branched-chain amino acid transport system ATP-binding protein